MKIARINKIQILTHYPEKSSSMRSSSQRANAFWVVLMSTLSYLDGSA
jgi:hypothetical protein